MKKIIVEYKEISISGIEDMVIASWLRKVDTLEFLQLWEKINNENFKPTDFEDFKSKPG